MSSLRDQLQVIYDARGRLTPSDVVDAARDKKHPLHARFDWDDAVAGEKWRRQQAHELIRSVKIVYKSDDGAPREIRAFHAVRQPQGHVYEPVEKVVMDPILTEIVRRDMAREWRQLKQRYDQFSEFYDMVRSDVLV